MSLEWVSRPHARNLVEFARQHPEVLVLSADLTASCEADELRDALPQQFFSMSMAEQNMVSMAGGLAREGFVPYIHTFAVFLTRRVFDQVTMSVAYANLKVRFMGFLPGITTPGGVTHQAVDDLALMRVVPNMTIFECGDATEVESVLAQAHAVDGPVYVRMLRGEIPRLFPKTEPLEKGRGRILSNKGDIGIISAGICTEEAMKAVACLGQHGVFVRLLHLSTLKPWGCPELDRFVQGATRGIITLENHSVIGGWGSAVAEHLAQLGSGSRLVRLGLQDTYAHGASKAYLMREYGLDARAVVDAVEGVLGHSVQITDEELSTARIGQASLFSKAEDL